MTDPRLSCRLRLGRRLRSLGLATATPVLVGLVLAGCSDSSTATAGGTTVTTDSSASGSTDATTDDTTGDTAAEDHDHDHGTDTTAADHSHGTDDSAADHDHAEGALDVEALHDLDDELAGGTLDAEKQGAVVADYIEQVEAMKPAAGSPEAELLTLLQDLDAALAAGDLAKAAPLAMEAHDAAHELGDHHA